MIIVSLGEQEGRNQINLRGSWWTCTGHRYPREPLAGPMCTVGLPWDPWEALLSLPPWLAAAAVESHIPEVFPAHFGVTGPEGRDQRHPTGVAGDLVSLRVFLVV